MDKIEEIDAIKDIINSAFHENFSNYNGIMEELHNFVKSSEINSTRMQAFKKLNNFEGIYDALWSIAGNEVLNILGPDVMVQTKVNLSIQMPHDHSSVLPIHSDCWSGDSPYQINLWIPLTNCHSTSSMFLLNLEKTKKTLTELYSNLSNADYDLKKSASSDDYIGVNYGEYLIFNPALLHGNNLNVTNSTRVSINIRYKSLFTPGAYFGNPTRDAGVYYKLYKQSEWTELARLLDGVNKSEG